MNVRELMILALTDLVSAAPNKELPDEETSKSAINHVKIPKWSLTNQAERYNELRSLRNLGSRTVTGSAKQPIQ
jgi:hypothetical protein